MKARIISTGSYLPEKILTNEDLSKIVDTTDEWITKMTGIKQRHIAAKDEFTSDLAYRAALDCLNNANLSANDIDGIVLATTTPDYTFPAVATQVQAKLGIKGGFAFDVQAVCSGFVYALTVAESFIVSGKCKRLLVIAAETMSKILDFKDRSTCVLFGDGAGAVILEATENDNQGIIDSKIYADGNYVEDLKTTGGPSRTNTTGCLTMNGHEVFKHATTNLSNVLEEILKKNNINYEDISLLIPHQANIRIIEAMGRKLKLDKSKIVITIEDHANTGSASVALALDLARKNNRIKAGDLIVLEAMGGGFTWGAILLKW